MTSRSITIGGFVVVALAALVVQFVGRRNGNTIPTFGDLVSSLMRSPPTRIGVLFVWWWIGWHFFTH